MTAAVMSSDRVDSRLPHILDRLRRFDPVVVRDRGTPWRTARAAWSAIGPAASHHLVVQDDIRIAPALPDAATQLARAHPGAAFAFYAQWDTNCSYRVRMAALGGDRLVDASGRDWVPAQALLLPRQLCAAIAALPEDADRDDDEVLAALLYRSELAGRTGIAVPNLVEHDDDPEIGYNHEDGLRRSACFADSLAWQAPAEPTWDGYGWEEVSVVLPATGVRLDWGIYIPEQPRRLRHIHLPWRMGVPHAGLRVNDLLEIGDQVLARTGRPAPAAELAEYAVACALHGVAWRNWWRGGRPAAELVTDRVADTALRSLWGCGGSASVPDDVLLAIGWEALQAGTKLDGVVPLAEFHARLASWFDTAKASLPASIWANRERE